MIYKIGFLKINFLFLTFICSYSIICASGIKEKGDLTSLVNLRNDFSHGQKITATIANIMTYFQGGCKILEILDYIIQP